MSELDREEDPLDDLGAITAQIVTAYVSRNAVPADRLAEVISTVAGALRSASRPQEIAPVPRPAVSPSKSVRPDHVVCLECGRKMRVLRGHLRAVHGLSDHEYRQRHGLPFEHPLVAPSYSAYRSEQAKSIGFWQARNHTPIEGK